MNNTCNNAEGSQSPEKQSTLVAGKKPNGKSQLKTVTVFTNGDSRELKTWSNVPFFFTETLISKGIKVYRVDLGESPRFSRWFSKTVLRIVRWLSPATSYCYFRSVIHFMDVNRRIKRALKEHPDSEANIFLTFSFSSAGLTSKPTILVCDWTYGYQLNYFLGREPDCFERASIRREDCQIKSADLTISLFPAVASYMANYYPKTKIHYLGNVVNSVVIPDKAEILTAKADSKDILFVGRKQYIAGAKSLIAAYRKLEGDYPGLQLHIVGMEEKDFSNLPSRVKCYGYLDKAKPEQKAVYYGLLKKAKVFVNTTPQWGSFSAMLEAMHFYNPIVTTPFGDWVATFGEKMNFGCYCEDNSEMTLCSHLKFIFETKTYDILCANAHEAVMGFSWDNYIEKVLNKIQACLDQQQAN
jgi:glycosyltransferase involved in cell wall biosynthesis